MSEALQLDPGDLSPIPPQFAELMWPEVPAVVDNVVGEIRSSFPEYDRSDERYAQVIELAVNELLTAFVRKVADPNESYRERDGLCRMLGQLEFHEGRSLDSLQAAFRLGLNLCLQRALDVGHAVNVPDATLGVLPTHAMAYLDDIARLAVDGYAEAEAQASTELEEQRLQLLALILQEPPTTPEAIREKALHCGWILPEEVTMVAIGSGAPVNRTMLNRHLLVNFKTSQPHLLIPGPMTPRKRKVMEAILAGTTGCVGLTVPLAQAAASLRWARRALELAVEGLIPMGRPFLTCADHLMEVWLLGDIELVNHLGNRYLEPLESAEDWKRDRLTETLTSWLTTQGTAAQIGKQLRVHAQTVRYRLKKVHERLGDSLTDPDARFAIEAALRARWMIAANSQQEEPEPRPKRKRRAKRRKHDA